MYFLCQRRVAWLRCQVVELLHAGLLVGGVDAVFGDALAGAAGQAAEAHGGDGGGVCPHEGEALQEAGAVEVEFLRRVGVHADEGVDAFAAAGVDGGDAFAQLGEDAQPLLGGHLIALQHEVGEAGAAGGVPAAKCLPAGGGVLVRVGLPGAHHRGGEVPHSLAPGDGQAGAAPGLDAGLPA